MKRRTFFNLSAAAGLGMILPRSVSNASEINPRGDSDNPTLEKPIVISTWEHGMVANEAAWKQLIEGGSALDAVETGVRVTESDPNNLSVGIGGLPDRDGNVTLDACIMNHKHQCGAVAYLQDIENPISVARKVMEETPHVMLVGAGAKQFALEKGFVETELLTHGTKRLWMKWQEGQNPDRPPINHENHDTIGMLAMDKEGNLSGACTTSGWAYKLPGRVGDSPIIGAGLFVDNEVGAACATGLGEAVIRIAGSSIIVELMRQGHHPEKACEMAVKRIIKTHKDTSNLQVGFIAMNKKGDVGGYSVYSGFNYAVRNKDINMLVNTEFDLDLN